MMHRSPNRFYPPKPRPESKNPEFNIDLGKKKEDSIRQSKTDREEPKKAVYTGTYPNTPEAKQLYSNNLNGNSFSKLVNVELDSTYNSSVAGRNLEKKDSKNFSRGNDSFPTKGSPTNFWPLSISPSEEKR